MREGAIRYRRAKWSYRPKLVVRDFLSHWPLYFVSRRSLNSSRRTEFGASGHCRISTSDVSKIAVDRLLSKMRQCANDPQRSFATDRYPNAPPPPSLLPPPNLPPHHVLPSADS